MKKIFGVVLFFLLVFLILPFSSGIESSNYHIYNPTLSDGANREISSSSYAIRAVIGEISGAVSSSTRILKIGFWHTFVPPASATISTTSSESGGGGAQSSKEYDIKAEETGLAFSVVIGENTTREIKIINNENESIKISVKVEGDVKDKIVIPNRIELSPGENTISVDILVSERGIYTGEIIFEIGKTLIKLPVVINTKTGNFLFDASVSLEDKFKKVYKGDKITAQVNLLEVLGGIKVDVLINYVIKDFAGNTYLEESETIFVEKEKTFSKEFSTSGFPSGDYVLGIEVIYPGAYATSSSQFSVLDRVSSKKNFIQIAIAGIIFVIILVALGLIRSTNKKLKSLKKKKL